LTLFFLEHASKCLPFVLEEAPKTVQSTKQKTKAKGKGKRGKRQTKKLYSASSQLAFNI
jgi:hypothetical protein